jgi:tight adherence protein B
MHLLLLASIGVSSALAAYAFMRLVMRSYRRFRQNFLGRTARDLDELYADLQADQVLVFTIFGMVLLGLAALAVGMGTPALLMMIGIGYLSPRVILQTLRRRRGRRFNAQLVDAIVMISNSLQVGLNLHQAVRTVAREMEPPISEEFGLVLRQTQLGETLETALEGLAQRMHSEDLDLVVTAVAVAHQMGGNLAEIFDNISAQIRARWRAERKLESLTSTGRVQGILVALVPPLLMIWSVLGDPHRAMQYYSSALGLMTLGVVLILYLLAFAAISRLTRVED